MIGNVVEWLGSNIKELIPVRTIRPYQKGVKYTFGRIGGFADWWRQRGAYLVERSPSSMRCFIWDVRDVRLRLVRLEPDEKLPKQLEPGWHWFILFFQQIEIVDVEAEGLDLLVQSITTLDMRQVVFSANIEFETFNAVSYYNNVQSVNTSLENTARVFCARRIRKWNFAEAVARQDELEAELKTELNKKAKKWGIKILDVGLTDFVETTHYRYFGGESPVQKLLNAS